MIVETVTCDSGDREQQAMSMIVSKGIVDGSGSKPALVQDITYMVKKTYIIAPYLGAFVAYVMPQ